MTQVRTCDARVHLMRRARFKCRVCGYTADEPRRHHAIMAIECAGRDLDFIEAPAGQAWTLLGALVAESP